MRNPADLSEIVSEVEFANNMVIENAIDSALKASKLWSKVALEHRLMLISELLHKIKSAEYFLAEVITKENGKTLGESLAEINSGLVEANYQIEFMTKVLKRENKKLEIKYEPLGTVLLITPWNFPIATLLRKMVPALLTGNSVILKPSEYTPWTSTEVINLIDSLNFPPGVINLVLGDGKVGSHLVKSKDIGGISLTGSTITCLSIKNAIVNNNTRLQAEMGGKNCVAVLKDADIEIAAKDIVSNGFACCGQWCTGTSKVVVDKEIAEDLIEAILELTKVIRNGNGMEETTTMGPLISEAQLNKVKSAVKNNEGAELLIGGKQPVDEKLLKGYFFEPTVFKNVDPNTALAQEEIFGPVLSIITGNNVEDILRIVNNSRYGLSFSVYTRDEILAEKFVDEVDAGLCHINLPTAVRDSGLPLLGWKDSGYGIPESGRFALDFYTKTKAVYRK
jgi:aldehyde dehydrogenase (NAD+)